MRAATHGQGHDPASRQPRVKNLLISVGNITLRHPSSLPFLPLGFPYTFVW